nr:NAD-dependent epimerase/dehydratase family protein [Brevundimonas diminuta]
MVAVKREIDSAAPLVEGRSRTKVLVTGASGFVGRRLVRRLATMADVDLVVAARSDGEGGAGMVSVDICDPSSVSNALAGVSPDVVVHLAAQSSVGLGRSAAADTWKTNLCGSIALGEAIARWSPKSILLYVSSAEVYGAAYLDGVVDESTIPRPTSSYAWTKLAAETALADLLPEDTRLIVARPSNHSGAGQDERFVLPSLARQIREGGVEVRVGNLSAKRDFLHVEDVVDAYLALLRHSNSLTSRSVFNVSAGVSVSIQELLEKMIELSGAQISVAVDPSRLRPVDTPVACIDSLRLRQATGWAPMRGVDEVLRELLFCGIR